MDKFNQIQKQIALLQSDFKIEEISLNDAFNRVLQEDVLADTYMPPFNKSAMDGYACRLEDIKNELECLEVIHAGMVPTRTIGSNQCAKIMTGAAVPEGADCVFKVEESETVEGNCVKCTNPKTHKNICYLGEDYQINDVLIKKGTLINVSQMAVLAGAGYHRVKVSVLPKIALINTGSELVEPHEKPEHGKIRNSNASQVISQLKRMNIEVNHLGIIEDDYDILTQVFTKAFKENDFVIFTGGASVGDFDWVPKILEDQGFEIFWDRTGMKPGNPMTFSQKGDKYCFGLSGNPVSSMVQFELIAKPVLYKLMGAKFIPFRIKATLDFEYSRKKGDRLAIVPVVINNKGLVERVPFNGSAHINSLVFANALMEIPTNQTNLNKGDLVYVRPL
ncbi:MAG: molybdopterin molybdotransferase MoeA [Bacteroidetes bacterium]|nr:molybdopterin molybdotransferase MoeA [Bacteroidota bacterium]